MIECSSGQELNIHEIMGNGSRVPLIAIQTMHDRVFTGRDGFYTHLTTAACNDLTRDNFVYLDD